MRVGSAHQEIREMSAPTTNNPHAWGLSNKDLAILSCEPNVWLQPTSVPSRVGKREKPHTSKECQRGIEYQQPIRMRIDESASKVRFGWSDEGVITSISRGAGRNTLPQWFESTYQSSAVLVKH